MPISFISCLTDLGANIRGSAKGSIPIVKLLKEKNSKQFNFFEISSSETIPKNNIKDIVSNASEVHLQELNKKHTPVLLGGDHSCAMASISSASQYCEKHNIPLYVFWFDAHADINTQESSETGNIHGMPVAMLMNIDKSGLILENKEYLNKDKFFLFGARSIDQGEKEILAQNNITYYPDNYLVSNKALIEIIKNCPENAYFHISFDVDCLMTQFAPGVSTPEPGGFSTKEALKLLEPLFKDKRTVSLDIVEYNPNKDTQSQKTLKQIDKIVDLFLENKLHCH